MRFFSTSEYELGVIAVGGAPTGIIAIGGMPVGVIAIGILPIGLLSFACGVGLGLVNFTCGIGVGGWVRSVGLAIGGDVTAVGLGVGLGAGWFPVDRDEVRGSLGYWLWMSLVSAAVLAGLWGFAAERYAVTQMTRVAEVIWTGHAERSEGVYVAPDTECQVYAHIRTDGVDRVHAQTKVTCGSLTLAHRDLRSGCTLTQRELEDGGYRYGLACKANRIAAHEDDDSVSPEVPGLALDTGTTSGTATIVANGPPPMHITLSLDAGGESDERLLDGAEALVAR